MGQLKQMLRAQILAEMTYDRQMSDEEIAELIDRRMDVCMEEQPEEFPQTLGERLKLHRELFDSFRRLDILQELVDDPRVTEIMVERAVSIYDGRRFRKRNSNPKNQTVCKETLSV